jgi:copper(I)-binding protein
MKISRFLTLLLVSTSIAAISAQASLLEDLRAKIGLKPKTTTEQPVDSSEESVSPAVEVETTPAVEAEAEIKEEDKVETEAEEPADTVPVQISDLYAFQTSESQKNGAVFMTLENTSDQEYRIKGASTDIAASVELHMMDMADDKMEMRAVPEIIIPAGETIMLEPSGYHIMLMDLKAPLETGESFPMRLILNNDAFIETTVNITAAGKKP